MSALAARVDEVRARIRAAGGDDRRVRLVAVTKGFGPAVAAEARACGLTDLGENYADELLAKAAAVPDARWHFLGAVQRRKVRDLAPAVALWHGVDRVEEGEAIARHAPGAAVLVQVNLSGEAHRGGCAWDEVAALVDALRDLGLDVRGLMGVAPAGPVEEARPLFRRLAAVARDLDLAEVSMGMSGDLEVAVEEGATIVRVGTALFGARPNPGATDVRR